MDKAIKILALLVCLHLVSCITENNYYGFLAPEPDGTQDVVQDVPPDSKRGETFVDVTKIDQDVSDTHDLDVQDVEHECVGFCEGKAPCEDDGCGNACEAGCDDLDPCNGVESCEGFQCVDGAAKECDNGLFCDGQEACNSETGECDPGEDVICDDGFSCNGLEECAECPECDDKYECVAGIAEECNDDNPCTTDSCQPEEELANESTGCLFTPLEDGPAPEGTCGDDNPCTHDNCLAGFCDNPFKPLQELGESIDDCICATNEDCGPLENGFYCDGTLYCALPPDLPDAEYMVCQVDPDSVPDCPAEDGLFCNGQESCAECPECDSEYVCEPGEPPVLDDGIACTVDSCDEENDVVLNTTTDSECDDGNVCTVDLCDPQAQGADLVSGCVYETALPAEGEESIPCTSADPCEVNGICDEMVCVGENLADLTPEEHDGGCDDSNVCSKDFCTVEGDQTTCAYEQDPEVSACEDGDLCTLADSCVDQVCIGGALVDCDDSNACTADVCQPDTGSCLHSPLDVDDDDPCTVDSCDIDSGAITHVPAGFDDGLFCNGVETCNPATGEKLAGQPPALDDLVGCTVDACDEENDVVTHTPDDNLCDNQVHCDGQETCDVVQDCQSGELAVCDDNDVCTDDSCDEDADGCKFENNFADCDDNDPCTENDICGGGTCAGIEKDCGDQVLCTINEACDAQGDCVFDLDHDSCDDGNDCTDDVCDPVAGCLNTPVQDGGACTLSDPCQINQSCQEGVCSGEFDLVNCGDLDHDGLLGADDLCPYAFDPGNPDVNDIAGTDACEAISDHGDFKYQRALVLSQEGAASQWRRTHEPVEIPLANGIIDDSVVGYWKLDGDAKDATGKHDGTNYGAMPTTGVFGENDGALEFEPSSGSYVSLGEGLPYNPEALSISVWISTESTSMYNAVLSKADVSWPPPYYGMMLRMGSDGARIRWEYYCGSGGGLFAYSDEPINDGKLHHIAITWDGGTVASESVRMYVDGKLNGTYDTSGGSCVPKDADVEMLVGKGQDVQAGAALWDGVIDDLLIFNRVLSPDEIETYYRSKAPYGTKFVPGAQGDFDDVRVTETGDDGKEFIKRSRVIGPRPHSDTPCPMAQDDGTWKNREDLCGVEAYWRLDGDAKEVTGQHGGVNNGATPTRGRFGDVGGAMDFDANHHVAIDDSPQLQGAQGTWEAWVRLDSAHLEEQQMIIFKNAQGDHNDLLLDLEGGKLRAYHDHVGDNNWFYAANKASGEVWYHIAFVWDGDFGRFYVDGLLESEAADTYPVESAGNPLVFGGGAELSFYGAIDEVIIHSVAKSPDYIYNRAHPGVPRVQFLANTVAVNQGTEEAPAYPLREYSLHWGDAAATAALPFVSSLPDSPEAVPDTCYGLLSECLGYAGWWRFNEGSGTVVVDSSVAKRNGTWPALASRVSGVESLAMLHESGGADYDGSGVDLGLFTVESAFRAGELQNGSVLSKSGGGDYNYRLEAYDDGALKALFEMQGGGKCWAVGAYAAEEWVHAAMQYDGASLSLWTGGQAAESNACLAGPLTTPGSLRIGTNNNNDTPFLGAIDSVRISNRALAPDEFLHYPLVEWEMETGNWTQDCGGMVCPELDGYDVSCNAKDHCEYANEDDSGWREWDVWIFVAPGSFQMGSEGEDGGGPDEMPVHSVTIDAGYFISKYEIVVEQYEACNAQQPGICTAPSTADWPGYGWGTNSSLNNRSDHPQNGLTWQEAKDYCAWIAPGGRLPSEAEWEYAATGPAHTTYPWGNTPDPTCQNDTAVFKEVVGASNDKYGCEVGGTWKAGAKSAGASWCGALDFSGNLFEWTADWYHDSYVNAPGDGSAWVDPIGSARSQRGGSFSEETHRMRSAARTKDVPGLRSARIGARCVRPLLAWGQSACEARGGYWAPTQLPSPDDHGCWFKAAHMQSCTAACAGHSLTCNPGPWNSDNKCELQKHWSTCNSGCTEVPQDHPQLTSVPDIGIHPVSPQQYCRYRGPDAPSQLCDGANPNGDDTWPGRYRLCVCGL